MNTTIDTLATIFASAIWADGVYEEAERVTIGEIAAAFEVSETELSEAVDKKATELNAMSDEQVNNALYTAGEAVDAEEIGEVFEAVLQILSADGVLTHDEMTNMLTVADALGISDEDAILLLVDMVKAEPEIEVSLSTDEDAE